MSSGFLASARRWITGAGLAFAVTAPSFTGAAIAATFVPMPQVAAPAGDAAVVQIRDRDRRARWYRENYGHRDRGWREDRGWRRDGWRDGRRYYHRRHGRDYGGLALGLGVGVPLGAYLASRPAYGYDGPYYNETYVVRRTAPRYVYRDYGGNRHTNWCYGRYRSYRAYDNTFQPYNGPRQLCYSPYS